MSAPQHPTCCTSACTPLSVGLVQFSLDLLGRRVLISCPNVTLRGLDATNDDLVPHGDIRSDDSRPIGDVGDEGGCVFEQAGVDPRAAGSVAGDCVADEWRLRAHRRSVMGRCSSCGSQLAIRAGKDALTPAATGEADPSDRCSDDQRHGRGALGRASPAGGVAC